MPVSQFIALENIESVLDRKVLMPSIVVWNRLEGRPRRQNFQRALKAEVRDPLWMLSKQWQVGEFKGDDAGSPIFAKAHIATTRLTKYQPGDAGAVAFDSSAPFESIVEQRPVSFVAQDQIMSIDVRLAMGRQWLKLLQSNGLGSSVNLFVEGYSFDEPDPASTADATITAHPSSWQTASAIAGRSMDGAKLYLHLKADPVNRAWDGLAVVEADKAAIDTLAEKFINWYEKLFYQPVAQTNDAWKASQLEYQFKVSAPVGGSEKVLTADEYYHGRLDWYNLDIDPLGEPLEVADSEGLPSPEAAFTRSFLPTTVQFEGMPNTRWWTFEDGKTSFGDIKPDTTDINKLLLMEFGLIYANDWFLLPFQLPVGSLANVKGLAVTNVFGERTWVSASGSGEDEDWQRWAMYNMSIKGNDTISADTTLLLLPTVPKISEGKPLDDIRLVRDEVSNMVWGVEKQVPLSTGRSKPGREAGIELANRFEFILDSEIDGGLVVPTIPPNAADIRYEIMQGVPENWIPFLPVHIEGSNREIQLQRASMPRVIIGDPNPPVKVKPRTNLLRQGLEQSPAQPYFLYEEEVPRAGVRVTQGYQRTRWHDGSVYTWVGVKKQTGRGEAKSGLAFDRVKSTKIRLRPALRRNA